MNQEEQGTAAQDRCVPAEPQANWEQPTEEALLYKKGDLGAADVNRKSTGENKLGAASVVAAHWLSCGRL